MLVHSVFFCMIILIILERNIDNPQFDLTSWSLLLKKTKRNKIKHISRSCWINVIYRRLTSCFRSICVNCIYVAQWEKQDSAVRYNLHWKILCKPHSLVMNRIINIFVKRKIRESFMRSVHVLIILLYTGLRRLVQ